MREWNSCLLRTSGSGEKRLPLQNPVNTDFKAASLAACGRSDMGTDLGNAVVFVHGELISEMAEALFDGISRQP